MMKILENPRFYDLFGLPTFLFISILSAWMIYSKELPLEIYLWILLFIGIAGIIIDGKMVSGFLKLFKRK